MLIALGIVSCTVVLIAFAFWLDYVHGRVGAAIAGGAVALIAILAIAYYLI
jgi:hypothetical protein